MGFRHSSGKNLKMQSLRLMPRWAEVAAFGGLLVASTALTAHAAPIQTVFVIAMENHNWTQPSGSGGPAQIFGNPAAPFINSLVGGTATAVIDGSTVNISSQTAYANAYHNVLATPSGSNPTQMRPSHSNRNEARNRWSSRSRPAVSRS